MSQKRIDEIRAICKEHGNDPGELINILHTVQVWTFAQNLHPVQILFPVQKI